MDINEIKTKLKVLFNAQLTDDEKTLLKNSILKLEDEVAPAALAAPVEPTFTQAKTKEGVMVQYEGELKEGTALMVVAESGATPAPDGTHELEDGTKVSTVAGVITKVEAVEVVAPEVPAVMPEEMKAQFSAQKSEFEKEIAELKKLQLSTLKMIEKFLEVPFEQVTLSKEKPVAEMTAAEKYRLNNPL